MSGGYRQGNPRQPSFRPRLRRSGSVPLPPHQPYPLRPARSLQSLSDPRPHPYSNRSPYNPRYAFGGGQWRRTGTFQQVPRHRMRMSGRRVQVRPYHPRVTRQPHYHTGFSSSSDEGGPPPQYRPPMVHKWPKGLPLPPESSSSDTGSSEEDAAYQNVMANIEAMDEDTIASYYSNQPAPLNRPRAPVAPVRPPAPRPRIVHLQPPIGQAGPSWSSYYDEPESSSDED